MDLFSSDDFRKFTLGRLKLRGKEGYGQLKKLSEHLGVHTTYVSQVFKGEKSLSAEQGIGVAEFLGLTDLESRYFVKLIQLEKAGTDKLKKLIESEAKAIRDEAWSYTVFTSHCRERSPRLQSFLNHLPLFVGRKPATLLF